MLKALQLEGLLNHHIYMVFVKGRFAISQIFFVITTQQNKTLLVCSPYVVISVVIDTGHRPLHEYTTNASIMVYR